MDPAEIASDVLFIDSTLFNLYNYCKLLMKEYFYSPDAKKWRLQSMFHSLQKNITGRYLIKEKSSDK
jgi:hypothetical protein